jgi:peptidoglycan hydrolase-like protein with peptidoglycan-binding domain
VNGCTADCGGNCTSSCFGCKETCVALCANSNNGGNPGGGTDTTCPDNPRILSASSTDSSVTLRWEAATDNVGVAAYNIYNGGIPTTGNPIGTTIGLTYTILDLPTARSYTYTVKAKDAAGNESTGITITISTLLPEQAVPVIDYLKIQYYLSGTQITYANNIVAVNGSALNIAGLMASGNGLPYAVPANIVVAMTGIGYLKVGSSGPLVTSLHQDLNSLGYNCPINSSVYGTATKSEVKLFQELTELYVDGIVGPNTRSKLNTAVSQKNSGWLSRGMINGDVNILQNDLYTLGHYHYDADDRFGQLTFDAVCEFQNLHSFPVDGIIKPSVRTQLNAALSSNIGTVSITSATASSVVLSIINGSRKKIRVVNNNMQVLPDYNISGQEASTGAVIINSLVPDTLYQFRLIRRNEIQEDIAIARTATQGTGGQGSTAPLSVLNLTANSATIVITPPGDGEYCIIVYGGENSNTIFYQGVNINLDLVPDTQYQITLSKRMSREEWDPICSIEFLTPCEGTSNGGLIGSTSEWYWDNSFNGQPTLHTPYGIYLPGMNLGDGWYLGDDGLVHTPYGVVIQGTNGLYKLLDSNDGYYWDNSFNGQPTLHTPDGLYLLGYPTDGWYLGDDGFVHTPYGIVELPVSATSEDIFNTLKKEAEGGYLSAQDIAHITNSIFTNYNPSGAFDTAAATIQYLKDGFYVKRVGNYAIIKGARSATATNLEIYGTRYAISNAFKYSQVMKYVDAPTAVKAACKTGLVRVAAIAGVAAVTIDDLLERKESGASNHELASAFVYDVILGSIGAGASIAAGAAFGAAIGTLIPVPIVGTLAGAAMGAAISIIWDKVTQGQDNAIKEWAIDEIEALFDMFL